MAQKYLYYKDYEHLGYDTKRELYVVALNGQVNTPDGVSISFTQVSNDQVLVAIDQSGRASYTVQLTLRSVGVYAGDDVHFVISADDVEHLMYQAPPGMRWIPVTVWDTNKIILEN